MISEPIAWLGRQFKGWPPVATACSTQMLEWKHKGWIIEPLHLSAQPSQVAYHGDVDLKWLSGSIGEVAHRLSTYMPTGLAEWADRARDCRIAAQVLSELSAQPSPGGQGDALPPLPPMGYEVRGTGMGPHDVYYTPAAYTAEQMQDYARAALAARQPVGAPAAWVHEEDPGRVISARQKATALRDQGASGSSVRPYSVPAYLHAPAQAVNLANFKALYQAYVRLLESGRDRIQDLGGTCDPVDVMEANDVDLQAARRVIDSQAVGNGN